MCSALLPGRLFPNHDALRSNPLDVCARHTSSNCCELDFQLPISVGDASPVSCWWEDQSVVAATVRTVRFQRTVIYNAHHAQDRARSWHQPRRLYRTTERSSRLFVYAERLLDGFLFLHR